MPGWSLPLKMIAQGWFVSKNKTIPFDWKQPTASPDREHFTKAFTMAELVGGGPPAPRPYFFNATPNKYHADAAKAVSEKVKTFVDTAIDKIVQSVDLWRVQAKIKDLKIMAVCAIGTPGCLDGPKMKDLPPFSAWVGKEKNEKVYIKAVVEGFSKVWEDWQGKVMVPGLPWYPAFAAFPGPMAPPMPSVPMPLITLPSAMMAGLAVYNQTKKAFLDAFKEGDLEGKVQDKQHEAIFESIAMASSTNFLLWLPMQQVMAVMGKGPIPTFAPPYVPVGPVMAGDNLPIPGHTAA
jgi:hypothetical protein